jgi:hypothetical protein
MPLSLPHPFLPLDDGDELQRRVQRQFEGIGSHFPLAPSSDYFQRTPQAAVYSSGQNLATATTDTLSFTNERWDITPSGVAEQHSNSTNPSRLTCRVPGLYKIDATVKFGAHASGGRFAALVLNGSTEISRSAAAAYPEAGVAHGAVLSRTYRLAVGDYLTVQARQTSGSTLTVDGEFAFAWISP